MASSKAIIPITAIKGGRIQTRISSPTSTVDTIIAVAAINGIVPKKGLNLVITAVAINDVVVVVPMDRVILVRADDPINVTQRIASAKSVAGQTLIPPYSAIVSNRGKLDRDGRRSRGAREVCVVEAAPAVENIVAGAAPQFVVAAETLEQIITAGPYQGIVT